MGVIQEQDDQEEDIELEFGITLLQTFAIGSAILAIVLLIVLII
jgi:hypothetical protein